MSECAARCGVKEDGMVEPLELRAVFGDGHGGIVEKKTPNDDPREVPQVGRAYWAKCFADGFAQVTGETLPGTVDPMRLFEVRIEKEIHTPRLIRIRDRAGKRRSEILRPREWYDRINELVLLELFPSLKGELGSQVLRRIARAVRRLHREDLTEHKIYPDGREFLHWVPTKGLRHYITTAQEKLRAQELLDRGNAPWSCFEGGREGLFTTERFGASKMRKEYWIKALAAAKLKSNQVVAWGNNTVQDSSCTMVGIPALILDRDGTQRKYFMGRGRHLRGVRFVNDPHRMPSRGPFIAFVESPQELMYWITMMIMASQGWRPQDREKPNA